MDFFLLLGLLVILLPLQMLLDIAIETKTNFDRKGCDYLLAFIPLLTFFYPEHYLYSFLSLAVIVLYGISLRFYAAFNDWLEFDQDRLAGLCLGGLGLGGVFIIAKFSFQFLL
ncbi:hypothetical protein [Shewanella ulleungensis]|uniref:Uncharacterized protein n=1 Tax=Shewanella ulleungensis TaxID=2282699 RepID=A0ABQ2QTX9_9GAMM|nr:hypothetical protein [Shewanella ulleungensis]MCL1150908.1 hypothetical protein [Shewanella ulleungensis]GGP95277.1 hypothetical protein GCM10009410_31590 [Shewanella ulleungensis]